NETAVVSFVNFYPGEPVSATIVPVGNAKGHEQYDGRHDEEARAEHLGSLSNHAVASSGGACEVHTWTLVPSEFSGKYEVKVTVLGVDTLILFTVKVPGLTA